MDDLFEGRAKGGLTTAKRMTPEARQERARKGAIARWGMKALHRGNFEKDFGFDVDCYVLDDEQKTAVISQSGMGQALGLPEGARGRFGFSSVYGHQGNGRDRRG